MVALPRSARLACWTNSWLSGATSLDEADDAIRADDTAHHMLDLPGETTVVPLLIGLGGLRRLGARGCALALPTPGDPLGSAGPAAFTTAALEAGEAVVCEGAGLGFVPVVVGSGVQWQAYAATPPPPLALADTATELTRTLHEAIEVLGTMNTSRWRPELTDALTELRGREQGGGLAPGYSARADHLAARASVCLVICELIEDEPDPGANGLDDAASRRRILRELGSVARRAMVAACAPPR